MCLAVTLWTIRERDAQRDRERDIRKDESGVAAHLPQENGQWAAGEGKGRVRTERKMGEEDRRNVRWILRRMKSEVERCLATFSDGFGECSLVHPPTYLAVPAATSEGKEQTPKSR